jgi:4-hydroxyphenylacetate 3-hydroxylase, reductase component
MAPMEFHTNTLDPRAYRGALGRFATGVALVAARDDDGAPRAITINSFCSVSLDPPIISWAIDAASDRHRLFVAARDFSVNILAADQQALAERFTRKTEARIEEGSYDLDGMVPLIKGAVSRLTCATRFMETVGDHTVIFATVRQFEDFGPADMLGYCNGRFTTICAQGD